MDGPEVGLVYEVKHRRKGEFRGKCTGVGGEFWEFELETRVAGESTEWEEGERLKVRASLVEGIKEVR